MSKCSTSSMKVFNGWARKPWDQRRVQHLYRRAGFGAKPSQVKLALRKTPSEVVDAIIKEAKARPVMRAPWWADWTNKEIRDGDGASKNGLGDSGMRALWGSSRALIRNTCLLYTSPSPRDGATSRMPSSA